MSEEVLPESNSRESKKSQVSRMFDHIAGTYDFLNHFLSLGIDIQWRRKVIKALRSHQPKQIIDLATGTGDLAIEATKLNPEKVVGVDISEGMLDIGRKKLRKKGLEDVIKLTYGDSENLDYQNHRFDAAMVAFGVRNYEDLDQGLREIYRVIKPGGMIVVLEFSQPEYFPMKQLYMLYFRKILPLIGRLFSKNRSAYSYLPESVLAFPSGKEFLKHLQKSGFKDTSCLKLTFGIASIYQGIKS